MDNSLKFVNNVNHKNLSPFKSETQNQYFWHPAHFPWSCPICVRPGIQSKDQNQFFTFKVRTFWQSEVKISVLALWLGALSSPFHYMGVGGMDIILSLYVPGMFRGVWKNVLTLNVLYTDLSLLWMPGRTHYTHMCIVCPHFECPDR